MNGAESLVRTLVGGGVTTCFAHRGAALLPDLRHVVILLAGLLVVPCPTFAQPSPSATGAFDGKYAGMATQTALVKSGAGCAAIQRMEMKITADQVVIHEIWFSGPGPTYQGSVNAAGEVSAYFQTKQQQFGGSSLLTVSGTIRNNAFTGQRARGRRCYYDVEMVKQ